MNRCLLMIAAGVVLAAVQGRTGVSRAADRELSLPAAAPQAVLLLHNGQVLAGRVARSGDYWLVGLPSGEIRVRQGDVQRVCRDLHECYQSKRQAIDAGNVRHHLDLGHWCVSQGLLDEAEHELREAIRAEPRHPRIALLQRQIELAREPQAAAAESPQAAPLAHSGTAAAFPHELSREDIESFTVGVQPLLVNRCAAAGCHGPDGPSDFRLLRGALGRTGTQRITQRNLRAVLAMIHPQQPDESPLLRRAMKAHGGGQHPPLGVADQAALRGLQAWIHQVVRRQQGQGGRGEPPAALAQTLQPLTTVVPAVPGGRAPIHAGDGAAPGMMLPGQGVPAVAPAVAPPVVPPTVPTPAEQLLGRALPGEGPPAAPQPATEMAPDGPQLGDGLPSDMLPPLPVGVRSQAPGDSLAPRDPFDPEIFNRRYGAARGVPPAAEAMPRAGHSAPPAGYSVPPPAGHSALPPPGDAAFPMRPTPPASLFPPPSRGLQPAPSSTP